MTKLIPSFPVGKALTITPSNAVSKMLYKVRNEYFK